MRSIVIAAVVTAAAIVSAEETKLGTGVTLKDATPIESLVDEPQNFVGKTVRVDGVATAVCEHMGCWMAVSPEGDKDGRTVRLKVDDGVIVFPVTAKGRKVSAEGVFEVVTGPEAKEAAALRQAQGRPEQGRGTGEHAKHDRKASAQYQIKATGAVIR